MPDIERWTGTIHDWTCGCGKGQACPRRDGCHEAAAQIAEEQRAEAARLGGAALTRDERRYIVRVLRRIDAHYDDRALIAKLSPDA